MHRYFFTSIITTFVVFLSGCFNTQQTSANIRYRVFEAVPDAVEKIIGEPLDGQIGDSDYAFVPVSASQIESLIAALPETPEIRVDKSRDVSWWPSVADTWSYSTVNSGYGGGAGFLGVRTRSGDRHLRIEYNIFHGLESIPVIESDVFYEGFAPDEGLLLLYPFEKPNGEASIYIIAFEVTNWTTS